MSWKRLFIKTGSQEPVIEPVTGSMWEIPRVVERRVTIGCDYPSRVYGFTHLPGDLEITCVHRRRI